MKKSFKIPVIGLIITIITTYTCSVFAVTESELKNQKNDISNSISQAQDELNDIKEEKMENLIKNQSCIVLRFSTENLDVEDRISQFSDILHYFKQIHFDFESFNVSERAKSISRIYNKNQGTQPGGSEIDI